MPCVGEDEVKRRYSGKVCMQGEDGSKLTAGYADGNGLDMAVTLPAVGEGNAAA
jgi:hypothetical protein